MLCRGRLHLYADNERGDREPMMTRSVHMCSMEVRYSQQCGSNILEFDQWGAGKTYHLRPLPSNDEKLYQWVSTDSFRRCRFYGIPFFFFFLNRSSVLERPIANLSMKRCYACYQRKRR